MWWYWWGERFLCENVGLIFKIIPHFMFSLSLSLSLLPKLLPELEHTLLQFLYRAYHSGLLSGQVPLGN